MQTVEYAPTIRVWLENGNATQEPNAVQLNDLVFVRRGSDAPCNFCDIWGKYQGMAQEDGRVFVLLEVPATYCREGVQYLLKTKRMAIDLKWIDRLDRLARGRYAVDELFRYMGIADLERKHLKDNARRARELLDL